MAHSQSEMGHHYKSVEKLLGSPKALGFGQVVLSAANREEGALRRREGIIIVNAEQLVVSNFRDSFETLAFSENVSSGGSSP